MTGWLLLSFYDRSTPRRWVLALELPSIWLLSVQFNPHSVRVGPVSISLRADTGASLWRVFCQLIQSDSFRVTHCSLTGPSDLFTLRHERVHHAAHTQQMHIYRCIWLATGEGSDSFSIHVESQLEDLIHLSSLVRHKILAIWEYFIISVWKFKFKV